MQRYEAVLTQMTDGTYNEIQHLVPDRFIVHETHSLWLIPAITIPHNGTGVCAALHQPLLPH